MITLNFPGSPLFCAFTKTKLKGKCEYFCDTSTFLANLTLLVAFRPKYNVSGKCKLLKSKGFWIAFTAGEEGAVDLLIQQSANQEFDVISYRNKTGYSIPD